MILIKHRLHILSGRPPPAVVEGFPYYLEECLLGRFLISVGHSEPI